jgi:phosphoribosylformimino-5-aminoimidazole carboxamide ribotide isomerase
VNNFEFIPAIDVLGGRCVQLAQGKYDRATIFDDDPVAVAARFAAHPIRRLHVVDLDGAKDGRRQNADVIRQIVEQMGSVPV